MDDLSPELQVFLTGKGLVRVSDDVSVYTMKPSMKNAIIALNYLFELNLFEGKLLQEFVRNDFVATYLPKLATALHATIPSVEGCDDRDFTSAIMVTPFTFTFTYPKKKSPTLVFKTEKLHGILELCPNKERSFVAPAIEKIEEQGPLSIFLMMPSDMVVLTTSRAFLWLFAQDLSSQAIVLRLKKLSLPWNEPALEVQQFAVKKTKSADVLRV